MIVDLHNHTPLCNHATGYPDEYVKEAIKNGCKYFGFADHAPMNLDQNYRMRFDQMDTYEEMIKKTKEKYKKDIKVLLAYEVDFLENYMDDRIFKREVDYLIGSVHFINEWGFDNPEFIDEFNSRDIDHTWEEYFAAIERLAKSGKFDIVGHLDLMKIFKFLPKKDIRVIAKNALLSIKKSNMVVEINSAGYRKPINESYPSKYLLETIFELDIPITFSSDAHAPTQVGLNSQKIIDIAKQIGFKECAIFEKRERSMIKF